MDPCTNRPNNCLMKTKDFCRSQSDTCAEETNLVEGGNVDEVRIFAHEVIFYYYNAIKSFAAHQCNMYLNLMNYIFF